MKQKRSARSKQEMESQENKLFQHTLIMRSEWHGLLRTIKNVITEANIDLSIYEVMKKNIIQGDFSAIYLDSRLITDKKREKAQRDLNHIRSACIYHEKQGKSLRRILIL